MVDAEKRLAERLHTEGLDAVYVGRSSIIVCTYMKTMAALGIHVSYLVGAQWELYAIP
jgi:hypothetical protein